METPVRTITRDELKKKLDRKDDFVLLETLPKNSYDHAHIPGAKNLPGEEVRARAATLIPNKNSDVVVYCANPT